MILSLTNNPAHTCCLSFTHCHTHSVNDFLTHSMMFSVSDNPTQFNFTFTHCHTLSRNYLLSHSITLSVIDTPLTLRNNALTPSFYHALPDTLTNMLYSPSYSLESIQLFTRKLTHSIMHSLTDKSIYLI